MADKVLVSRGGPTAAGNRPVTVMMQPQILSQQPQPVIYQPQVPIYQNTLRTINAGQYY